MSTKSTLFLSDLTVVDHAYIDHRGNVVGGSFNPSFFVSGEVDPVEQVVVDFSAIKKQIKQIIDDKEFGFDHKLWFIGGYSKGTLTLVDGGSALVTTPTTSLGMPTNAVKYIENGIYSTDAIGQHMGQLVEDELRKLHPGINITVKCVNNVNCHVPTGTTAVAMFRYAHGLKDSTSWGCKNIAHGHLSYLQLLPDSPQARSLASAIAADLDDTIFIFDANIVENTNVHLAIEYTTEARGRFYGMYDKAAYKLVVLPTETTVEHLVDYVANKYSTALEDASVEMVLMSEGLSKGACVTISST
jgi:hypothetical protein